MSAGSGASNAAWLERLTAEIVRGRHVVLHGNVHDPVRWRNEHVPLRRALTEVLRMGGYETVGFYDVVDGITADGGPEHLRALSGVRPAPGRGPGPVAAPQAPDPPQPSSNRVTRQQGRFREIVNNAPTPAVGGPDSPDDAVVAVRRILEQDSEPVAFVVDFAELLVSGADRADRADRRLIGTLKKAMLGSAHVGGRRNLLVLVVHDLTALPEWLYQGEPFIQPIEALRPGFDERRDFLRENARHFYADPDGESWTGDSVRVLANLSEGMAISELEGLWRTSMWERISLAHPRELLNRTLVGRRQDPWARLAGRISGAEKELAAKVVGQPEATRRVSEALAAATLGIDFVADAHSLEARPKAVFFFVGPTGVGKTELAKALSELIYDDAAALARFDMSSFAQPHSAERFTGAPPGYQGHERGGELTNRVRQRPFSLLLFDEIEKAHDSIFDRFLQVLDDGRLTDGLGRTSYFSHTLIVFTSNLGAQGVYQRMREHGDLSYADVVDQFQEAVQEHFTKELNRPELLGRFGNGIVPFDILRPENLDEITRKFLGQLVRTAERTADLRVDEESVLELVRRRMADPAELALGARRIRDTLDRAVRSPLVHRLVTDGPGSYDLWVPRGANEAMVATTRTLT